MIPLIPLLALLGVGGGVAYVMSRPTGLPGHSPPVGPGSQLGTTVDTRELVKGLPVGQIRTMFVDGPVPRRVRFVGDMPATIVDASPVDVAPKLLDAILAGKTPLAISKGSAEKDGAMVVLLRSDGTIRATSAVGPKFSFPLAVIRPKGRTQWPS